MVLHQLSKAGRTNIEVEVIIETEAHSLLFQAKETIVTRDMPKNVQMTMMVSLYKVDWLPVQ